MTYLWKNMITGTFSSAEIWKCTVAASKLELPGPAQFMYVPFASNDMGFGLLLTCSAACLPGVVRDSVTSLSTKLWNSPFPEVWYNFDLDTLYIEGDRFTLDIEDYWCTAPNHAALDMGPVKNLALFTPEGYETFMDAPNLTRQLEEYLCVLIVVSKAAESITLVPRSHEGDEHCSLASMDVVDIDGTLQVYRYREAAYDTNKDAELCKVNAEYADVFISGTPFHEESLKRQMIRDMHPNRANVPEIRRQAVTTWTKKTEFEAARTTYRERQNVYSLGRCVRSDNHVQ
jgi:hypothetical protein